MTRHIYDSNNTYLGTAPGTIGTTHIPADVSASALAAHGWHEGDAPSAPEPETEQERAARLAPEHGTQVAALVQCLAQFGLSLPVELDDAITTMYAALETQPELMRHALLAQAMYTALHNAGVSDRDIYLTSEVAQ